MFKIFVAVVLLGTGQMGMLQSNESYDSKDLCEQALPSRIQDVKNFYKELGEEAAVEGECAKVEAYAPTKPA